MKRVLIDKLFSSRSKSRPMCSAEGFTLIELSIVLIVIGLVLALGVPLLGTLAKRVKFNESREIVNAAVDSVGSWAAGNSRLPDWSGAGNPADFRNIVKNPNDAFSAALVYSFDNNLIGTASPSAICGRRSALITLVTDTGSTIPNVAYVVVSGADDYAIDTRTGGSPLTSGAVTSATTINADTTNDIVRWVTIDELRTKIGCGGPQLVITNAELSQAFRCSGYTGAIYAGGGVPFSSGGQYRWCIQNSSGLAPANLTFKDQTGANNVPFRISCSALAEASWVQADYVAIGGTPNAAGNYALTFYARDNNDASGSNDNVAQKSFVLAVGTGDNRFRAWNNTGTAHDFMLSSKGLCSANISNGSEITEPVGNMFLNAGDSIIQYASVNGSCATVQATYYFADAVANDANCNFQVNISASGVTDR